MSARIGQAHAFGSPNFIIFLFKSSPWRHARPSIAHTHSNNVLVSLLTSPRNGAGSLSFVDFEGNPTNGHRRTEGCECGAGRRALLCRLRAEAPRSLSNAIYPAFFALVLARGLCLSFLALTSSFFDGGRRGWMLPLLSFDVPGGVAGESDIG